MGSSLGLALKKRGAPVRVHAFARREAERSLLLERGAADAVFESAASALKDASMIVFCTPVLSIPELVAACRDSFSSGAIVTDVGSTKSCLNDLIPAELNGRADVCFVGSHPICGSEQQGADAGDADLYDGAMTVVTPLPNAAPAAVEKIISLWKAAGSNTMLMDAAEHDRILAATSHLPHVAAAALVLAESGNGVLCGSGFRDTTRIAEGSPQVWSDIVRTNAPALKASIAELRKQLSDFENHLDSGDEEKIKSWFAAARDKRRSLLTAKELKR